MTRHITRTGFTMSSQPVTCYICHRGQLVLAKAWSMPVPQKQAAGMVGDNAGQNVAAESVAWTALPLRPVLAPSVPGCRTGASLATPRCPPAIA